MRTITGIVPGTEYRFSDLFNTLRLAKATTHPDLHLDMINASLVRDRLNPALDDFCTRRNILEIMESDPKRDVHVAVAFALTYEEAGDNRLGETRWTCLRYGRYME